MKFLSKLWKRIGNIELFDVISVAIIGFAILFLVFTLSEFIAEVVTHNTDTKSPIIGKMIKDLLNL